MHLLILPQLSNTLVCGHFVHLNVAQAVKKFRKFFWLSWFVCTSLACHLQKILFFSFSNQLFGQHFWIININCLWKHRLIEMFFFFSTKSDCWMFPEFVFTVSMSWVFHFQCCQLLLSIARIVRAEMLVSSRDSNPTAPSHWDLKFKTKMIC